MKSLTKVQAIVIAAIIVIAAAGGAFYYTSYGPRANTFKIGAIFPFTGPYGTQAIEQKNALLLAIDDINKEGGVMGKPVEAIIYDDQMKVDQAVLMVDKLVEQDKVDMIAGVLSASNAYAVHQRCKELHKVFAATCLPAMDTFLKKDMENSGTFAIVGHGWNLGFIDAHFVVNNLKDVKKIFLIIPAYKYGYDTRDGFSYYIKNFAKDKGVEIAGIVEAPVGAADYTPYLSTAMQAKPDLIFTSQAGHDLGTILKQMSTMGIQKSGTKIINPWSWMTELMPLDPAITEGVYFTMWYYWNLPQSFPESNTVSAYAQRYQQKYGKPPDNFGGLTYVGIREICRGVNLAQSTNPDTVRDAILASPSFDTMKGTGQWRIDHQPVMKNYVYITVGKPASDRSNEWDVCKVIRSYGGEEFLAPLELEGY